MKKPHLTAKQLYLLECLHAKGKSYTEMARELGCHRTTVRRELARNGKKSGGKRVNGRVQVVSYDWREAVNRRWRNQRERDNRSIKREAKELALHLLTECHLTPEMISAELPEECPMSAKSIYRMIHADKKRGGKLHKHLVRGRRKPTKGRGIGASKIKDRKPISERPAEANERSEVGHWEADLIVSSHNTACLLVCVDRASRFGLMRKLPDRKALTVAPALLDMIRRQPVNTMTFDNGSEFAMHTLLRERGIDTFFFDIQSTINSMPMKLHGWHSRAVIHFRLKRAL